MPMVDVLQETLSQVVPEAIRMGKGRAAAEVPRAWTGLDRQGMPLFSFLGF